MRKPKTKKKVKISDEETPPQNEIGGTSLPDLRLPPRLFATDRFPTKRLNIYSSPDLLPFIRNVLRDMPELETIRQSCFGKLFDLPARQCPMSCKLIHLFLTRQLVSLPKNTLRSAFGGSPFRYGLEEFGIVTGLPCGFFPERYNPNTGKAIVAGKDRHNSINSIDICRVKFDPNLVVTPIIPIESQAQPGWGLWPDDVKDDKPLIKKPKNRVKKKAASIKQSLKSRQPFRRKQRRISSYVTRSSRPQLHQRSTYGDGDLSFNACEAAPLRDETISFLIQDDSPMETDELPQTRSPIISQYEAQLHRDSTADHLASSPVSDPCIHTQSVHVSPNHNNTSVHASPDHNIDSVQVSPVYLGTTHHTPPVSQMITHTNDATDDYNEPPLYDKSDHPHSPEIHHILYHGVRIYDAINPDPPIFDSSIPPASLPRSRLLLSPQPTTMLTSPIKSNDSLSGFTVHAATVNAFTATASSNSPPSLALKEQNTDGVVDLTATKNMESHVPSLEENHLAHELSKSPLITALALISPLPDLEWDLFYSTISTMTKVFHTTPPSFEFSNKFLLELAKPKQWTTTRLTTFGAQTKENLCRRFYRCEIGVKRQSGHHLFKWIDEEIIDEISKVDSKLSQLQADVQSFKRTTTQCLQEHGKNIDKSLLEMKRIIHDQTIMLAELRNNSTLVVDASYASLTNGSFVTKSTSPLLKIAVAAIALGTMAWLYEKITT
ncbi:hypothetical protein HID58_060465 [Brassica napus]|uniref:Uncharacterized protein n=1 Tax=Brassica napus TaxID=3708 RepID=A0ABQ7ZVS6_BRANA|nr:hypothetical protein HID58_060465 [Brassica napus]